MKSRKRMKLFWTSVDEESKRWKICPYQALILKEFQSHDLVSVSNHISLLFLLFIRRMFDREWEEICSPRPIHLYFYNVLIPWQTFYFSSNCKWTYSLLYSWRITTFWHSLDNTDNFFKVWERHGLELGMNFLVVHQNFKRLFATNLAFDLHTRNCSLYDPKTKCVWSVKLNWYIFAIS